MSKRIWFDISNPPHVHLLIAIFNSLKLKEKRYEFIFSCRDFAETVELLKQKLELPFITLGGHYGKPKLKKVYGVIKRFMYMLFNNLRFDVTISCGSEPAIWTSALKRKNSIAFGDNDKARQWTYGRFVDYVFFPDAIPEVILTRQGIKKDKIYRYHGYKEDIYLADFKPDRSFIESLPFNHYIVVRPENVMANYLERRDIRSIVPILLKKLTGRGINIFYLPRYDFDREYAKGIKNVYIPDEPVNGLDACYYADAVLTGAGTLAREAACLGVPAVSFYAGKELLLVDQKMIKEKWTFFSRDAGEIVDHVIKSKKRNFDLERCKNVKEEVITKLDNVIERLFR